MRINQTVNGRKINSKGVWTPVIVLDPGHSSVVAGGYEPLGPGSGQMKEKDTSGTQGVATGVEEYKLNLSIGLQLRTLLQKRGFNNRSKNSLTSIGDGMNCTFEHICLNACLNEKVNSTF